MKDWRARFDLNSGRRKRRPEGRKLSSEFKQWEASLRILPVFLIVCRSKIDVRFSKGLPEIVYAVFTILKSFFLFAPTVPHTNT